MAGVASGRAACTQSCAASSAPASMAAPGACSRVDCNELNASLTLHTPLLGHMDLLQLAPDVPSFIRQCTRAIRAIYVQALWPCAPVSR